MTSKRKKWNTLESRVSSNTSKKREVERTTAMQIDQNYFIVYYVILFNKWECVHLSPSDMNRHFAKNNLIEMEKCEFSVIVLIWYEFVC